MHHTTCRDPGQVDTQQKNRIQVCQGQRSKSIMRKNTYFRTGYRTASSFTGPNRFKMHHTTCRDPGQVDTQQKTGFKYVKVKGQGQICEETPILTHYHAQCAGLPFKWVQNTNTFKVWIPAKYVNLKKHLQVKGQGHQLDAGLIMGLKKKRGTAQRLRLPAESFQNAPYDVP